MAMMITTSPHYYHSALVVVYVHSLAIIGESSELWLLNSELNCEFFLNASMWVLLLLSWKVLRDMLILLLLGLKYVLWRFYWLVGLIILSLSTSSAICLIEDNLLLFSLFAYLRNLISLSDDCWFSSVDASCFFKYAVLLSNASTCYLNTAYWLLSQRLSFLYFSSCAVMIYSLIILAVCADLTDYSCFYC